MSEWIPLTERLPPYESWVLTARAGSGKRVYLLCFMRTDAFGHRFSDDHGSHYDMTHWMLLPEPPNGEIT